MWRQCGLHALRSIFCRRIFGRPLDLQYPASVAHQRAELLALHSATLFLIGTNRENGEARRRAAEFSDVVGITIQQHPRNSGLHGGARHLRETRTTDRFAKDRVGPGRGIALNDFQELRSLRDGVVVGEDDLRLDAETRSGLLRGSGLFELVIVFPGHQGNNHTKAFHGHNPSTFGCWPVSEEDSAPGEQNEIKRFKAVLYRETYQMQRYRDATKIGLKAPAGGTSRRRPGTGITSVALLLRVETVRVVERLPFLW